MRTPSNQHKKRKTPKDVERAEGEKRQTSLLSLWGKTSAGSANTNTNINDNINNNKHERKLNHIKNDSRKQFLAESEISSSDTNNYRVNNSDEENRQNHNNDSTIPKIQTPIQVNTTYPYGIKPKNGSQVLQSSRLKTSIDAEMNVSTDKSKSVMSSNVHKDNTQIMKESEPNNDTTSSVTTLVSNHETLTNLEWISKSSHEVSDHESIPSTQEEKEDIQSVGQNQPSLKETNSNQQHQGVAADNSTNDTTSKDHSSLNQLNHDTEYSPYELLRMERIKRNKARLASLGLLSPLSTTQNNTKPTPNTLQKKIRTKATPSTLAKKHTAPTRRSSRLCHSGTKYETVGSDAQTFQQHRVDMKEVEQEEEDVKFTISPVLQYAMEHPNNHAPNNTSSFSPSSHTSVDNNNNLKASTPDSNPTFYPKAFFTFGPTLIPPAGLTAIYSLHIHSNNTTNSKLIVGAGKSGIVSLWNWHELLNPNDDEPNPQIKPMLTWKGHKNRWISSAHFVPCTSNHDQNHISIPRLLTAGNDGAVCLWDLSSVSTTTGTPKTLFYNQSLHSSGIFAMDVVNQHHSDVLICTGSKDKTIVLSDIHGNILWQSHYHTGKVGAVSLHPTQSHLILSASDDGSIALHDTKQTNDAIVSELVNAHVKPHSVAWDPLHENQFMTAGHDDVIKTWDMRYLQSPQCEFRGHVPANMKRYKGIHHPVYYHYLNSNNEQNHCAACILTGGEQSRSLSFFRNNQIMGDNAAEMNNKRDNNVETVYSRGLLPHGCGDAGAIVTDRNVVAVAVSGGEVLMLSPEII